ncbi:N-acetylglucosamine-6-phosphate deacetylase [Gordonia rhizosphera]|uniref:N-acetylglucosamine-6-phosphate deacetylase n=1 Tax=Gordonia rhizosphera NBRC 16068 TaxID=1108045 RepID=K6WD52_9ACTN|nr:N-acetylglucosamine-6-phosphate deacetylase [Gordonia rhizosphera]GAB91661.1 N-acetylglucosamine-6-phosphate deacetylase [Gordonia rhizosphera NBRC 16068]
MTRSADLDGEQLVAASAVVSGGHVLRPGWFTSRDGRITSVSEGLPARSPDLDFPTQTIVPGFVDMHVHGGGGATYTAGDPDSVRQAAAFHQVHGTTTTVASLVSAGPSALLAQVRDLGELVADGVIAGIHLEGPWLSHSRCGAHDPTVLRPPDPEEIDRVLRAGAGTISMVTIAPELDGALDAIARFADAGVVVAVGHTEATYEQTRAAIGAGARVGTHLFNAMRPLHHREPGPVLALLEDDRVTVEMVGDGVHVHQRLLTHVVGDVGAGRVALVTDAMAAAGMSDGSYRLGVLEVDVTDAVARVRATGAIAGSTATMGLLFERALASLPGPADAALTASSAMASTTPARAIGVHDAGDLSPGMRADWVVVDDGRVQEVYRRGALVADPGVIAGFESPRPRGLRA